MKFASVLAILAAVSATIDCYPLILETSFDILRYFYRTIMKFASVLVILAAASATIDCYPLILETSDSAMDKRDLHDFCGGWFCGHVKREEALEANGAITSASGMPNA
ncbi:hypothetical protein K493DRAFT_300011 [Basidiobolus meristosporus CBS 931.73]|uniref:Uncharacterized protein n=1 Tax=Basidiobolus meristosporus CBS 931.73 TaxID=1314790 RepID=A0A1Y1YL04_9FUNG|nr:hypothetical protein K493DRAFT_300011 [Basidiobolus meristosporus CBS 931.73]|eukprot:ORX98274.1 hypothetical protein K493DRAFT_300011 [Basidiobolus meristosporus CBS 931.73]